jgi:hypothetical protein
LPSMGMAIFAKPRYMRELMTKDSI